jgi:hypothetical protein
LLHGLIGLDGGRGGGGQYGGTKFENYQINLDNLVVRKKILHYFEEPGVELTSFIESSKAALHSVDLQESPVVGNKLAKLSSHINTFVCVMRCVAFCVTDFNRSSTVSLFLATNMCIHISKLLA